MIDFDYTLGGCTDNSGKDQDSIFEAIQLEEIKDNMDESITINEQHVNWNAQQIGFVHTPHKLYHMQLGHPPHS